MRLIFLIFWNFSNRWRTSIPQKKSAEYRN